MKLRIERDALVKMLRRVAPATKAKTSNPALSCVLLTASDGRLAACAFDGELRISTSAPSHVETHGVMLVPFDALNRLVGRCPAGAVDLELDAGRLGISAGRVRAHLVGADPEVFPVEPRMDGARSIELGDDWHALQRVVHAAATDAAHPTLTGILLRDGMTVCTDRYRLAACEIAADCDLLLPARVITAVDKAAEGPLTLSWQGKRFTLTDGSTTWQSTAIDGEFPPQWRQLIPTSPPISLTCNRDELLEAVQTVAAIGEEEHTNAKGEKYTTTHVALGLADGIVTVSAVARDKGDAEVEVEAKVVDGLERVVFDARWLISMLSALEDDDVTMAGPDHLKPWVARERDLTLLLIPVRA